MPDAGEGEHLSATGREIVRNQRLARLFVILMVVGSLIGIVIPAGIRWDFGNFYDAGRRVLASDIAHLYLPRTLIAGHPPQATTGFWGTPLTAYLYVPIALFPAQWGLVLFKIETAVFSLAALGLLYDHTRRFVDDTRLAQSRFAAAFAFVSLIYQPIWVAFRTGGQTTPMVFFFLVLAVRAITSRHALAAAVSFATAVMIKPALITALVFFVLVAGFKYLKYTVYVLGCTGLVSIAVMGWGVHEEFLRLMVRGMNDSVPWFYNSGLYTTFENLKLLARPDSWPVHHAVALGVLKSALKLSVAATFAFLVYRMRGRHFTDVAYEHLSFLLAISFFSLFGHIVYEAYLTFLLIVLAYLLASSRHLSARARAILAGMFFFCFWQNIIWVDLLRSLTQLDTVGELVAVGLFKSGVLILFLAFLWLHFDEFFRSYDAKAWSQ